MKKIMFLCLAIILFVISIGGFIFCELKVNSFDCEEINGEVVSMDTQTIRKLVGGTQKSPSYKIEYLYNIELKVEEKIYSLSFSNENYPHEVKIGGNVKAIKYVVDGTDKIDISKSKIRSTETPIILYVFTLFISIILFVIDFLKR